MRLHLIWFAVGVDVPGWLDHAPLSLEEPGNVLSPIGEAGDRFGRDWLGGFASLLHIDELVTEPSPPSRSGFGWKYR
jgi:hypothetical protein